MRGYAEQRHLGGGMRAEKQSVPLYGKRPYRGYDRRKFENEAECCTALIHEDGHFESGAFYKPFSVYQVKQQAENKAWRSAFRKRIPWCELKSEILKGFSVWEIAEHFNVTAQCIWDAYLYYRDVCGVCMQEDT